MKQKELTPREIVKELDAYIVGQDNAKKAVAIALRNRWRRQRVEGQIKEDILPNNIILIGPTGVGKTEIARRLSNLSHAPFIKVEASKFTEVGYVGRDVESIIRDLTSIGVNLVKSEKIKQEKKLSKEFLNEKILDILFPIPNITKLSEKQYIKTRKKFKKLLDNNVLEQRLIEINVEQPGGPSTNFLVPVGMGEMGQNIQEMLDATRPKIKKTLKITIEEARKIFIKEETEKIIDMDRIVREAVKRVEETGIVFLDEIDKIASNSSGHGPDISREGVQRDILPIVEGSNVQTKFGVIKTDHILFIAAGAFHNTKPSDLIPELQGRFPIREELQSLGKKEFIQILKNPKNALLKQYTALLETENVEIIFKDSAIIEIANLAAAVNNNIENIGARRLHTILSTVLEDILFTVPDKKIKKVIIDKVMVQKKLANIIKDKDLSRYIL